MSIFRRNITSPLDTGKNNEQGAGLYSNGDQGAKSSPVTRPRFDESMYDETDSYQNPGAHVFQHAMADGTLSAGPLSPAGLMTAVKNAIASCQEIDPEEVEVHATEDRQVTLTGSVGSEDLRQLAFELAQNCEGVRSVQNDLHIIASIDSPMVAKDFAQLN